MPERKPLMLRLDPATLDALRSWAADELRSVNAQIEFVLRRALREAGRLPALGGSVEGAQAGAEPFGRDDPVLDADERARRREPRLGVPDERAPALADER